MIDLKKLLVVGVLAGALILNLGGLAVAQSWEDDPTLIPMSGNKFLRPELVVPAGTVVTWVNWDGEFHDVIERTAFLFESPLVNTGEIWQMQFDVEGTYQYVCDLHGNMEGVIVVTAPVAAAPAPAAAAPAATVAATRTPADPYRYSY